MGGRNGKRQAEIPGTERPNSIPELDGAVEKFKASSKKRKQWQDTEIEDRDLVVRLMEKHGIESYEDIDAGLRVTLSTKVKAKVVEMDEDGQVVDSTDDGDEADDEDGEKPKLAAVKPLKQQAKKKEAAAEA